MRRWPAVAGAVAVLAAAGLVLTVVASPDPPGPAGAVAPSAAEPCQGTQVGPGDDLQRTLDGAPDGATICFAAGLYRLAAPLRPAGRQRLVAAPGTVLSGAVRLDGWRRDGRRWQAAGALPAEPTLHGECLE